ncbi:MAG: bifunctional phosphopantothenoylcysteine decarboxylase/phosphopantothenate--cysteine ligase CoaBC [Rhodothermia bacterium]|nr:bifunctional phosphopantothenoylcysteine decarboxylase/phosphopantothenate--cysteine ligase CoaBC [Rhodothermia bacterium]
MLQDKFILLGITGSIAAYKAAELVRLLKKADAKVQVLMTPDAERFIPALTLGTLSESEVYSTVFSEHETGSWTKHIALGISADLLVIAPATAQTIAKLAHGFCDSMLTATALAARCPVMVCPAMDHDMYEHPATQNNLSILRSYGYAVLEPEHGELASGLIGKGRLPEPAQVVAAITSVLTPKQPLLGQHLLLTAGPTREAIDPVRYISNHSTGTMGYAIAETAREMGAKVTLVTGPVSLPKPNGIEVIEITSAAEMNQAVQEKLPEATFMVAAAAVADYAPAVVASQKLKKKEEELTVALQKTPDILYNAGLKKRPDQMLVGFALETHDAEAHAQGKIARKNLDFIVLNDLTVPGAGFGTATNQVVILGKDGSRHELPLASKKEIAAGILHHLAPFLPKP